MFVLVKYIYLLWEIHIILFRFTEEKQRFKNPQLQHKLLIFQMRKLSRNEGERLAEIPQFTGQKSKRSHLASPEPELQWHVHMNDLPIAPSASSFPMYYPTYLHSIPVEQRLWFCQRDKRASAMSDNSPQIARLPGGVAQPPKRDLFPQHHWVRWLQGVDRWGGLSLVRL